MSEPPKYQSFTLANMESYPLDLPEQLDESHSCPYCANHRIEGDDDVQMVHDGFGENVSCFVPFTISKFDKCSHI